MIFPIGVVVEIKRYNLQIQRDVFLALNIAAAISMTVMVILFLRISDRVSKQSAVIQQQRIEAIFRNCHDQNKRHDATIASLHRLAAQVVKEGLLSKKRVERSVAQNTLIIDALAPRQNCIGLVQQAVPTVTSTVVTTTTVGKGEK